MVFLEVDQRVGDVQLSLEQRVPLRELGAASLGFAQLRLAPRCFRLEARGTVRAELRPPGTQERAVDALPP